MEQAPTWIQHFDVVQVIMAIMLGLITWFAVQSFTGILKQLDTHTDDIKDLQKEHVDLKSEFSELKGAHDATHPTYNGGRW